MKGGALPAPSDATSMPGQAKPAPRAVVRSHNAASRARKVAARIALRNLFLHRSKSLLVGVVLCMGIFALFVGNSLIDTAVGGMRRLFVQGYTGDVMVTGRTVFPTTIFADLSGGEEVVPHIAEEEKVAASLRAEDGVAQVMPMLSGKAAVGIGESLLGQSPIFGVNFPDYRRFFPDNLELLSGAWPKDGESWMLASEETVSLLEKATGSSAGPGTKVILSSLAESAGTVIREVEIKGVVRFTRKDSRLSRIDLVDADSLRDLLGFASLRDEPVALTAKQSAFVDSFDPDALFTEEDLFKGATTDQPLPGGTASVTASDDAAFVPEIEAAWQFVLVKLKEGASAQALMSAARGILDAAGSSARVQDWVEGAGATAKAAMSVRFAFALMVSVVAVVIVLIAMNALVVSVGERIAEIGTLRAIGARRAFVRNMIAFETAFLAIAAGLAGLALGTLVLFALGKTGVRAPNIFFEALFGGPVLKPEISGGAALGSLIWIIGMSLFSSWYPVTLALRIRPVAAMRDE